MRSRLFVVALLFAFGFIACGDDPPTSPVVPSFFGAPKSLQITGELAFNVIGQNRQLTATATFANGSTRNVTSLSQWSSSNPGVATVSNGLVRVVSFGEAQITATYRNISSAAAAVSAKPISALTSITIAGPGEIAPGNTSQFTATGHYNDSSTLDITSTSSWGSFNSSILRHTGSGRFQAVVGGETRVEARLSSRSSSVPVLVLPPGTFKLSGTVKDSFGGVEDVTVQVVSGIGAGLSAKTTFGGRYALYGVGGVVELRASAPGYQPRDLTVTVNSHSVQDLQIDPDGSTRDIAGQWTVIIGTSSACSSGWSEAARKREVTAVIQQQGTQLKVQFSGPGVQPGYDNLGRIAGSAFTVTLYYDYYYGGHGLLYRVSDTEWVGAYGTIKGEASQTTITGNFNGTLDMTSRRRPRGDRAACPVSVQRTDRWSFAGNEASPAAPRRSVYNDIAEHRMKQRDR